MRKFNVALNVSKLETKKVQLAQIESRLRSQLEAVQATKSHFEAKLAEVTQLETAIKLMQSTPTVS